MAYCLAKPVFQKLERTQAVRRRPEGPDQSSLQRAATLLAVARAKLREKGPRLLYFEVLALEGAVLLGLACDREAIAVYDEGLRVWPEDAAFLGNKHLAEIREGNVASALETATRLVTIDPTEGTARQVASLISANNPLAAKKLIDAALLNNPEWPYQDGRIGNHLLLVFQALGDKQGTREWVDRLLGRPDASPLTLIGCAECLNWLGDGPSVDRVLERAEARADPRELELVRGEKGRLRFFRGDWAGALECFGHDGLDPLESRFAAEIVCCLVQIGDLAGGMALGRRLEDSGLLSIPAQRALVAAYARTKNDPAAARYANMLVEGPDPIETDYLNLFELRRRLGPFPKAIEILEKGRTRHPSSPLIRSYLAHAYLLNKQQRKSLAEARELTRLAPDSSEAIDTWARFGVFNVNPKLFTSEERARIGRTMEQSSHLQKMTIPVKGGEPDLSGLVTALQQQQDAVKSITGLYEQMHLPGSMIADALGRSLWELWWEITNGSHYHWWMAQGDETEQSREQEAARAAAKAKMAVLDYSLLCTFSALGQLEALAELFTDLYVTTATRDIFAQELQLLDVMPESVGRLIYLEGKLVMVPPDPAVPSIKRRWLTDTVDFIDTHCKIAAPSPEIWKTYEALAKIPKKAGAFREATVGTMLAAKTLGAAVICDEALIRLILAREIEVPSFCSQALLRVAAEQKYASLAQFETLERLLELNYSFVSVHESFLKEHLTKTGYRKTKVAERLMREIGQTQFTGRLGMLALGMGAAALWFNPERWPRDEWGPLVREQVRGTFARPAELLWFSAAIATELTFFPSVAFAMCEYFFNDPEISPIQRAYLRDGIKRAGTALSEFQWSSPLVRRLWNIASNWDLRLSLDALSSRSP